MSGPASWPPAAHVVHVADCGRHTRATGWAMAKRNLTVQLDEEVIHGAKVAAAKRGTSVSGLVAQEPERGPRCGEGPQQVPLHHGVVLGGGRLAGVASTTSTTSSTVAPDDEPGLDPWTAAATRTTLDIASGSEDELDAPGEPGGSTKALDVAVAAVRGFLRRRACAHPDARRYCPDCGAALVDPAAP